MKHDCGTTAATAVMTTQICDRENANDSNDCGWPNNKTTAAAWKNQNHIARSCKQTMANPALNIWALDFRKLCQASLLPGSIIWFNHVICVIWENDFHIRKHFRPLRRSKCRATRPPFSPDNIFFFNKRCWALRTKFRLTGRVTETRVQPSQFRMMKIKKYK